MSQAQFALTQVITGEIITCSDVDNSNPAYTECTDLKRNGLYFPNGVTCGPSWKPTNSKYSDTIGFCQLVTGSQTSTIEAYYACGSTSSRAVWKNGKWSTMLDNGFTKNLRCYY